MSFNCDFNAPMFVDFENGEADTNPESYFEVDHEATSAVQNTTNVGDEPIVGNSQEEDKTEGSDTKSNENQIQERSEPAEPSRPRNLVSSWGAMKKEEKSQPRVETPTRRELRKAVADTVAAVTNSPKLHIPERAAIPKRLGTNLGSQPRLGNQGSPAKSSPGISRWRRAVAQMTPEIIRNARQAKLKRQQETEKVPNEKNTGNMFKLHLARNRKASTAATAATAASKPGPVKALPLQVVKPTNPEPFKFATDSRFKGERKPEASLSGNIDFSKMLRSYNKPAAPAPGITEVKPFSFCGASKRSRSVEPSPSRRSAPSNKFVSTAELLQKFQRGTPDRFHSQPRGRSSSANSSHRRRSPSPHLTRAQTPKLLTRGRSRPNHVLSREQMEEMELEEAKKHQFRATAINEGIKPSKPAHIDKKPPTQPEPFHFSSRPRRPASAPPADEPHTEFHAKPVPKKILDGPVGVPERRAAPLVVPQSPAFVVRERKRPAEPEEPEKEDRVPKARPVPHFGVPVKLQNDLKKVTTAEPFSFYERDKEAINKKKQKMAAAEEEAKKQREFKANPLPDLSKPVNLPMKEVLMPTRPEPFQLQIEKRVGDRLQKWEENLNKELEQQREAAKFHARPAKVLEQECFVPKPSDKPLTEVSNFELHSDRRAREREEFDQHRKQKEAEMDAMKRQLEERRKQEEMEEISRIRREAVHKAQPIKNYKPVEIHPSDKPLTQPVSPKFSKLSRERNNSASTTASQEVNRTYEI